MPMVFVLVGVFTSARFLNLISLPIQAKDIELLTEITLALLLFADATTLSYLRHQIARAPVVDWYAVNNIIRRGRGFHIFS